MFFNLINVFYIGVINGKTSSITLEKGTRWMLTVITEVLKSFSASKHDVLHNIMK